MPHFLSIQTSGPVSLVYVTFSFSSTFSLSVSTFS